jgi:hypothetical protein
VYRKRIARLEHQIASQYYAQNNEQQIVIDDELKSPRTVEKNKSKAVAFCPQDAGKGQEPGFLSPLNFSRLAGRTQGGDNDPNCSIATDRLSSYMEAHGKHSHVSGVLSQKDSIKTAFSESQMMMRGSRGTNESGQPPINIDSDEPEARISQLRFSSSVMRDSVIEDPFPWKPEHEI